MKILLRTEVIIRATYKRTIVVKCSTIFVALQVQVVRKCRPCYLGSTAKTTNFRSKWPLATLKEAHRHMACLSFFFILLHLVVGAGAFFSQAEVEFSKLPTQGRQPYQELGTRKEPFIYGHVILLIIIYNK